MVTNVVAFDAVVHAELQGWTQVEAPFVLVEIPASMQRIKAQSMDLAHAWRMETRAIFEAYFAAGYTVTGIVPLVAAGSRRVFYVLEPRAGPVNGEKAESRTQKAGRGS